MSETSRARNILFQQFMNVPHRDYAPMVTSFRDALFDDPDFIARACVHICTGGSKIRDQQDAAIITLLQSPPAFPEYREAGRCLLLGSSFYAIEPTRVSGLPPFRILRVAEFIKESDRKVPRQMRGIMGDWLSKLQTHPTRFDGVVLRKRREIKQAFQHYWVAPSERTQAILYENNPPPDSKLHILKVIAKSTNIREQLQLIIEHEIPYTTAASILPKMTPAISIVLIERMTPTEALNSRAWVEQSGILEHEQVRDVFVSKIAQATASIASADFRKSAQGSDERVQVAVEKAKEKANLASAEIEKNTLYLVDKSSSMGRFFNVAQVLGPRIASRCTGGFMCVLFNDFADELRPREHTLKGWQQAFRGKTAGGWTSPLAGLNYAIRKGEQPEQIIIQTDGGENRPYPGLGAFARGLAQLSTPPNIVIIGVPGQHLRHGPPLYHTPFTRTIQDAGYNVDEFQTDGSDYYIHDQITAVLGDSPSLSLVEQILETDLPHRVGWIA